MDINWNLMTAEEAQQLAAGLQAEEDEVCGYCGGEGGEPAGLDYYVPCRMCNDGRG